MRTGPRTDPRTKKPLPTEFPAISDVQGRVAWALRFTLPTARPGTPRERLIEERPHGTEEENIMATKVPAKKKDTRSMVVAVFRDRTNASQAYNWLLARGYSDAEINVMMSNETRAYYEKHESKIHTRSHAAEGAATGGAVGAIVGGTAAAVATLGSMAVVPFLGFPVAGALLMGLAGAGAGAVTGGVLGALIGLGIPESNADAYEEALKAGGVVVGVEPHDGDSGEIKKEFKKLGGENIIVT
jgi:hypothetical protein